MFSQLYELLGKFKRQNISLSEFELIKQAAKKQARKSVFLWKFKPEIRILFKMARYQSYLMFLLGITVLPFTLYQKYTEDKQKLSKIIIFTPFGLIACVGPLFMYRKFSKKLIQAVSYNFQQKKMIFTRFKDGKQIFVNLKDINYTSSDKGRTKQLIWNKKIDQISNNSPIQTRKYQIQGLGQWQSNQLFKFLIQTKSKQQL